MSAPSGQASRGREARRRRRAEQRAAARGGREHLAERQRTGLLADEAAFAWGLTGLFLVLALVGVLNHEMWRDEWQSWLIGRESASLQALLARLHDESQPPLWLTLLYLLARVTGAPVAMQLVHALVATASVFVVARYAPFRRWEKALYAIGYFPLYEYCVVSRNYALGILFAWLFCTWLARSRYVLATLALAALSWSSHQGLLIAVPMMGLLAARWIARPGPRGRVLPVLVASVGFAGALAVCAWIMASWNVLQGTIPLRTDLDPRLLTRVGATVWNAFVPLPYVGADGAHWNTNALGTFNSWLGFSDHPGLLASDPLRPQELAALVLAVAALVASGWTLARDRAVMVTVLAAQLLLLVATYVVYFGWLRHHGHLFVVFLMGVWLLRARAQPGEAPAREGLRPLLPALLALQAVAGLVTYVTDLQRPFTASTLVPQYLRAAGLTGLPVLGSPDYLLTPIAGALEAPFYSIDTGRVTTAAEWKASKGAGLDFLLTRAGERVKASEDEAHLLITGFPIESQLDKLAPDHPTFWIKLTPLATFAPRMVPDEAYAVYYAQPRGHPVPERIQAMAIGATLRL